EGGAGAGNVQISGWRRCKAKSRFCWRRGRVWHLKSRMKSGSTLDARTRRAEREGFEPSIRVSAYAGLANRCLQPLGHLSGRVSEAIGAALVRQPVRPRLDRQDQTPSRVLAVRPASVNRFGNAWLDGRIVP